MKGSMPMWDLLSEGMNENKKRLNRKCMPGPNETRVFPGKERDVVTGRLHMGLPLQLP